MIFMIKNGKDAHKAFKKKFMVLALDSSLMFTFYVKNYRNKIKH